MPGSAVSDLAGRVLAGRYLLHGAIGTGASGRVYAADDTRLRRRVAVKVLHAALAEDAAFLRRFRAEAQLAASLHHPHIVTVHDWGEDDVPFMVLELLEGGSLRSMLDHGTLLTVAQAARVGRDVASALEYAHARGVLHRDVKPANLLFDEHGIVRVADFGLARALAEASWTEPAGAVFGTARYASPEQAQGLHLDARSDLYSLGLVLVEAVTGRIPFAADTTLGTLTARTQRPISAPEQMGVLGPVVERVGAIDPDERYPDAATLRQALSDAGDRLPPPSPLLLAGMTDTADPHPTRAVPVPTQPAPLFDQDAIEVVADPAAVDALVIEPDAKAPKQRRRGERRLVPIVVAIVLVVTIGIAAAALARIRSAPALPIPGLVGLNVQQAKTLASKSGIDASVGSTRSAPDPAGVVIDQRPHAGAYSGSRHVTLVVSSGPPKVAVPAIAKQQWNAAKAALDSAGLLYDNPPKQRYDASAPVGAVLSVTPNPGVFVAPDSKVDVVVSAGRAPVNVADVTKQQYNDAAAALTAQGFQVKRGPDAFSNDVDKGLVITTDPAPGKPAPYGSTITVTVSKGPDLVVVPDLTNLKFDEASAALSQQGLLLAVNGTYSNGQRVISQDQTPGAKIPRGSTVTVQFAKPSFIQGLINSLTGGG